MAESPHRYRYSDARTAFLESLGDAEHTAFEHPLPGPDSEIALDIGLWKGRRRPEDILVISSGTHGIEGYCGSFVQCALLDAGLARQLTEHSSLLMIHGVNPFCFAWQRRVNEYNVDLNRNFVDHSAPHPINFGYRSVAQLLEPQTWEVGTDQRVATELISMSREHPDDPRWLQSAWSGGQYEFPSWPVQSRSVKKSYAH